MENIAPGEIVLTVMERKMLTEIIEEAMSTKVIETCPESTKETNPEIEKGIPKQLKPELKEEVTEMTNDRQMKKTNMKDIHKPQIEELLRTIQNKHRKRSLRKMLQTFGVQRKDICQKSLRKATEEEGTAMIIRWILDELPNGKSVPIKLRNQDGDIFGLRMHNIKGCIYAREIRQCRHAKRLYIWPKRMTYNELTLEEIEKSVKRAEEKDRRKQRQKAKCEKTIPSEVKKFFT